MEFQRSSGVLLHPTSIPGGHGIGSFGSEAYAFVDFLAASRQKLWQILPLGPTGYGDSPYQCLSAFAGNPLLIDLNRLQEQGLLKERDFEGAPAFGDGHVDYAAVMAFKLPMLKRAYRRFSRAPEKDRTEFREFCRAKASWLNDFALFMALKERFHLKPWFKWRMDLRMRETTSLRSAAERMYRAIDYHKFVQYLFFRQWLELKQYANNRGIRIVGDMPLYVALDSADAWAHPDHFQFDERRRPTHVAGVPPDYFSSTGQFWGNPLYNWEHLKHTGFHWWVDRIKANLDLADILRIDHFLGLHNYWSVPARKRTARDGKWVSAPGEKLLTVLKGRLGELPFIAEDLGVITDDVVALREKFSLPGMKILQFGVGGGAANPYLPHNYAKRFVAYTGTHDNDNIAGWFKTLGMKERRFICCYAGGPPRRVSWSCVRAVWASVACMAVAPVQDLLGLGSEARMNVPGTPSGNWRWRLPASRLTGSLSRRLRRMTENYGR